MWFRRLLGEQLDIGAPAVKSDFLCAVVRFQGYVVDQEDLVRFAIIRDLPSAQFTTFKLQLCDRLWGGLGGVVVRRDSSDDCSFSDVVPLEVSAFEA